jgi:hypothetical protein
MVSPKSDQVEDKLSPNDADLEAIKTAASLDANEPKSTQSETENDDAIPSDADSLVLGVEISHDSGFMTLHIAAVAVSRSRPFRTHTDKNGRPFFISIGTDGYLCHQGEPHR